VEETENTYRSLIRNVKGVDGWIILVIKTLAEYRICSYMTVF
jgi:hypothetical protein